jgi:starch synthase
VAAEIALKKSGGLGLAVHDLGQALVRAGHKVTIFAPCHAQTPWLILRHGDTAGRPIRFKNLPDVEVEFAGKKERAWILKASVPFSAEPGDSLNYVFIDNAYGTRFGNRNLYGYRDDAERYLFFNQVVAKLIRQSRDGGDRSLRPLDLVQANDWSSGYVGYFLRHCKYEPYPYTPLTYVLHNLGYSKPLPMDDFHRFTGESNPWVYDNYQGMGFFGQIDPHKTAFHFADRIIPVSPNYAREVLAGQLPEPGNLYAGFLRQFPERVRGIMNGIPDNYGPADFFAKGVLPATYSADDLTGKWQSREKLQELAGIEKDNASMILLFSGRWAEQKGVDVLLPALPELLSDKKMNLQFVTVGGEAPGGNYLEKFLKLREAFPGRVGAFDFNAINDPLLKGENLEALTFAGSDFSIYPSRFEPCGLADLYAMMLGNPALAHKVGGLADAIKDGVTGFHFETVNVEGINWIVRRAYDLFRNHTPEYRAMMSAAMREDFSWSAAVKNYLGLYEEILTSWSKVS